MLFLDRPVMCVMLWIFCSVSLVFIFVVVVICCCGSFLGGSSFMWLNCAGFPVTR